MPTLVHIFPQDNMLNGYKLTDEYNKEFVCIIACSRWNILCQQWLKPLQGLYSGCLHSHLYCRCFYTLLNPAHSFTRTRTALTQTPAVTTALSRINESTNTTFSSGMLDSEGQLVLYLSTMRFILLHLVCTIQECLNISMTAVAVTAMSHFLFL